MQALTNQKVLLLSSHRIWIQTIFSHPLSAGSLHRSTLEDVRTTGDPLTRRQLQKTQQLGRWDPVLDKSVWPRASRRRSADSAKQWKQICELVSFARLCHVTTNVKRKECQRTSKNPFQLVDLSEPLDCQLIWLGVTLDLSQNSSTLAQRSSGDASIKGWLRKALTGGKTNGSLAPHLTKRIFCMKRHIKSTPGILVWFTST